MQFLRAALKQYLICGIYAVALVCSLAVYKRVVIADPLSVAQRHWEAIAAADPDRTVNQYSDQAVLKRSYGILDEVYQGQSIYPAWESFFSNYQIQNFQVVKQQRRNRTIEAEIMITAKSDQGSVVVLSLCYEVHFNKDGKITHEIWQANPEVSV